MKTSYKVGLFTLVVLGVLGFLIIKLGDREFGVEYNYYYVSFDDAQGLSKGADVQVRGVKAGKVEDLIFEESAVKAMLKIRKEIPVYQDAKVVIRTYGLMGDKFIYIDPGTPQAGVLASGSHISSVQRFAQTEDMINQIEQAARKFSFLMDNLNRTLEEIQLQKLFQDFDTFVNNANLAVVENREGLRASVENIRIITAELRKTLPSIIENLDRTLENTKNITEENRQNIRELIASLREKTPKTLDSVDRAASQLEQALEENRKDLKVSIENLREASKNLNQLLSRINEGQGTLGKLVKEDALYTNVNEGVKSFTQPFKILYDSDFQILAGGEKHTGNDEFKAGFGGMLWPSNDRYYYFGVLSNSEGFLDRKEETTSASGTSTLVVRKYGILFDLQYARKVLSLGAPQLWMRFGIKDSSAVIASEIWWDKRLRFMVDAYKFNREDLTGYLKNPQVDAGVEYRFSSVPLFIRAGGSDLANSQVRGLYIGGGFLFSEEYLKYLFGAVGGLR